MKFSAVILAGGKSSRMGRDKAFLDYQGQPLLAHQLQTVQRLAPDQIFISGRAGTDYRAFDCPVILDAHSNLGPLAGIAAAFAATLNPLLLALAVDMPAISTAFLECLLMSCGPGRGIVPKSPRGYEPLAAFYPREILPLITQQIQTPALSLQRLAAMGIDAGLLSVFPMAPAEAFLFENLNSPADLASTGA